MNSDEQIENVPSQQSGFSLPDLLFLGGIAFVLHKIFKGHDSAKKEVDTLEASVKHSVPEHPSAFNQPIMLKHYLAVEAIKTLLNLPDWAMDTIKQRMGLVTPEVPAYNIPRNNIMHLTQANEPIQTEEDIVQEVKNVLGGAVKILQRIQSNTKNDSPSTKTHSADGIPLENTKAGIDARLEVYQDAFKLFNNPNTTEIDLTQSFLTALKTAPEGLHDRLVTTLRERADEMKRTCQDFNRNDIWVELTKYL